MLTLVAEVKKRTLVLDADSICESIRTSVLHTLSLCFLRRTHHIRSAWWFRSRTELSAKQNAVTIERVQPHTKNRLQLPACLSAHCLCSECVRVRACAAKWHSISSFLFPIQNLYFQINVLVRGCTALHCFQSRDYFSQEQNNLTKSIWSLLVYNQT